jgi:23S rRNA pseudouridine1911/1915/1917 synthase
VSLRLDLALIRLHPQLSRRKAREVIEKGQVSVDGVTVREAGHAFVRGATLLWDPNRKALRRARLALPLLHRDAALLVVDKPAGLLTVRSSPEAEHEDTALARVQEYVRRLTPRHAYVGVVHRIDRDTSGALVFSLDAETRLALRELFREHRIERRYAAIVAGEPRAERGVVDQPIHDAYEAGRRRLAGPGEPSRPALTRFRVVERFCGAALLEVELETGRQHQIRVHLASIGLPLLGDRVYGAREGRRSPIPAGRQLLHARDLGFSHPQTGLRVEVSAPLPEDFERALAALRQRR